MEEKKEKPNPNLFLREFIPFQRIETSAENVGELRESIRARVQGIEATIARSEWSPEQKREMAHLIFNSIGEEQAKLKAKYDEIIPAIAAATAEHFTRNAVQAVDAELARIRGKLSEIHERERFAEIKKTAPDSFVTKDWSRQEQDFVKRVSKAENVQAIKDAIPHDFVTQRWHQSARDFVNKIRKAVN
jgi:hypothetical protein